MNPTELNWTPPNEGIYNGFVYFDEPIKVSNGIRQFIVTLNKPPTENRNISIRYSDGVWSIRSDQRLAGYEVAKVFERLEALMEIYPALVPKLRIVSKGR